MNLPEKYLSKVIKLVMLITKQKEDFCQILKRLSLKDFQIVINCTSIGFGKDVNKTPINLQDFKTVKRNTLVFDIIYKPLKTKFLRLAKKNKAKILNGLDMNLRQAVIAFGYTNKKLKSNSITLKYMRSA